METVRPSQPCAGGSSKIRFIQARTGHVTADISIRLHCNINELQLARQWRLDNILHHRKTEFTASHIPAMVSR
jgi:hypothetical protein